MATIMPTECKDYFTAMAGTEFFSPPEMMGDNIDPYCGKEADVWALGLTLVLLLFGQRINVFYGYILDGSCNWNLPDRTLSPGTLPLLR